MSDLLFGALGVALVAMTAADVFRSLLVPRANRRLFRLGPVLGRSLFPLWQVIAARMPSADLAQTVRATLAPLMLMLMLVIWAAMLICGFALLFWAERAAFAPPIAHFGNAFYLAGSAFLTANDPERLASWPLRIALIACGLSGLALVTVVATFLISVQGGLGRRETLVLRLEAHVELPPTGIGILETYAREDIVQRLAAFFNAWEEWAAEVAISHRAFPILMFFRSNDARCEWLAALGAVMDAAALLDAATEGTPPEVRAGAHFVLRTGARLLADMVDLYVDKALSADPVDAASFADNRRRLAHAGYELAVDETAARARFAERRQGYADTLAMLGQRLRIDLVGALSADRD